mmetsp:Transcript_24027/g.42387  ORF Transcript_24027/g.42387 Transcript_24027/m.42387 type:complete len:234 (+) Transcript_24027:288-989(+)
MDCAGVTALGERAFFAVYDLVGLSSPEEQRKRKFNREYRGLLKTGAVFKMHEFLMPEPTDIVGSVSRSMTSLLSGGFAGGAKPTLSKEADRESVWFALADSGAVVQLEWKTLRLTNNEPHASGVLPLHKVQLVDKASVDGSPGLVFRSDRGQQLLSLAADDATQQEAWHAAITEALAVLGSELESGAAEEHGLLDRHRRMQELQARSREREDKKKKLGDVGMQYTAKVLASRS